jgi:predicted helicase
MNDPNREDDPEYIVRLVGQVITVSVETVGL